MRQLVLDVVDDLSNHKGMAHLLTWKLVDDTAAELGAGESARLKWRQRGVPAKWRISIVAALAQKSISVGLDEFDALELLPGRIATPTHEASAA